MGLEKHRGVSISDKHILSCKCLNTHLYTYNNMTTGPKPPTPALKPPEAEPARRKLKFEIREVKTEAGRREFDRVLLAAFGETWTDIRAIATYDSWYKNHRRFVAYLMEDEPGRAVGTGMLAQNIASGEYAMLRFAVDKGFRHQGIASAMAVRIEEEAKKMGLTEIISYCAESLLRFYAMFGFKPVGKDDISPTDEVTWKIRKEL